jgi:polynucleotide 5'-kinase involved in rRNA processing
MNDKEFAELELRVTICPGQCGWPKPENIVWQKLHAVPNEARERVSKVYAQMDEIDGNADLSREDKQHRRSQVMAQKFEASKTLVRAREAVRCDASPAMLKALEQAEAGWNRAMDKIAERAGRTNVPATQRRFA